MATLLVSLAENFAVLRGRNCVLHVTIPVLQERKVVLQDKIIVLQDNYSVLQDSNLVLQDSNAVLQDSYLVLQDMNAVLEYTCVHTRIVRRLQQFRYQIEKVTLFGPE